MKTLSIKLNEAPNLPSRISVRRLPFGLKCAFTAFMAVLVPVYGMMYGPTNFLYFCDLALFFTLIAVWLENSLFASMAAVGIILPQFLWCADFLSHLAGFKFMGMTDYMFDARRPLFLRGLSLFHGWLPFLLLFLVARLGYDPPGVAGVDGDRMVRDVDQLFPAPRARHGARQPPGARERGLCLWPERHVAQTWMPGWAWLSCCSRPSPR